MTVRFTTLLAMAVALTLFGNHAVSQSPGSNVSTDDGGRTSAPRGDSNYPGIDYSTPYARDLHEAGASFDGWWGTIKERSDMGEPDHIIAVNFSANQHPEESDAALLLALCSAGDLYLAYLPKQMETEDAVTSEAPKENPIDDDEVGETANDVTQWIARNGAKIGWTVTVQTDNAAVKPELWQSTDAANGVLIKDARAEEILRRLQVAEKLTLTAANGLHSISSKFSLAGAQAALKPLIETCPK